MRASFGLVLLLSCCPAALAQGVPIQVIQDGFACRDISDTIRLGLRRLDGNKQGFMDFYMARQAAGTCQPLRNGTIGTLADVHDEQGLHLGCIRQGTDGTCFWALEPRFGPAPY